MEKAHPDVHPDGNSIGQIDVRVDYKPIYLDIVSKNMFDRISHCIQLKCILILRYQNINKIDY